MQKREEILHDAVCSAVTILGTMVLGSRNLQQISDLLRTSLIDFANHPQSKIDWEQLRANQRPTPPCACAACPIHYPDGQGPRQPSLEPHGQTSAP